MTEQQNRTDRLNAFLLVLVCFGLVLAGIFHTKADLSELILKITLVLGGLPILIEGGLELIKGKLNVDIIAFLAILGGFLTGEYLAGVIIVLMYLGGNLLEAYAMRRAKHSLDKLIRANPDSANLMHNSEVTQIHVSSVKVGDRLLVKPGEQVPIDAKLQKGESEFDQSSLTGESMPVTHSVGDNILSGIINHGESVEIIATKTSKNSTFSKIVDLVKNAQAHRAPINRLADKYGTLFTPFVVIFTALTWIITKNPITTYTVLVVATPCPLLIAAPVAIVSGIARAAKIGIIVKEPAALERGNDIDTIIFDKTGTLTEGKPAISKVLTAVGVTNKKVLQYAASLEQTSSHILASTIVAEAEKNKLKLLHAMDLKTREGQGLEAKIGSKKVVVGSLDFVTKSAKTNVDPELSNEIEKHVQTETMVAVAQDGVLLGVILFEDKIKKSAAMAVRELDQAGVSQQIIFSGDKAEIAASVAQDLGMSGSRGAMLPAEKLSELQKLASSGHNVAMVGDGTNDAPSISGASLGIAISEHGNAITSESADVVMISNNLEKIPQFFKLSHLTIKIAKQSIIVGMGLSLVAMVCAAGGLITPVKGAILQEVIDVTVILNALRVLEKKL